MKSLHCRGKSPPTSKIGDVAEIHRHLLQDRGHRQTRLLNAGLHQPGPAPIGRRRLGLGIVREFGAKGQKKRLRQQEKARAGAPVHAERKPRRRRIAIPPPERVGILDRRQPLEAQRDASDGSEGRLERLAQCAGERFEKRSLDRRARPLGFDSPLCRDDRRLTASPKMEETIRLSMRSSNAIMNCASGSALA